MSLAEKYRPKSLREIAGQDSVIKQVVEWLKKPQKALLLYGATGTGKTAIVEALANDLNYDLIELNASDLRNKEQIENALSSAVKFSSIKFKKGKIILFDEVDGLSPGDRGGAGAITRIMKESKFPVLLTANDAYSPKLREIRQHCKLMQLKRIHPLSIEKRLREVAEKEKIKVPLSAIKQIAKSAGGDMRAALNDLESFAGGEAGEREREKNVFEVVRAVFKTMSAEKAKEVLEQSDKSLEELFWWIEQNVPKEYEKPEEVASAFELLSKADLFRAKIRRNQNYRFLVYFKELIAAVALAKQKPYYKFTSYRPPERLIIMGKTKSERHHVDAEAAELAKRLHCSKRIVKRDFLPYFRIIKEKDFSIST